MKTSCMSLKLYVFQWKSRKLALQLPNRMVSLSKSAVSLFIKTNKFQNYIVEWKKRNERKICRVWYHLCKFATLQKLFLWQFLWVKTIKTQMERKVKSNLITQGQERSRVFRGVNLYVPLTPGPNGGVQHLHWELRELQDSLLNVPETTP